MRELRAAECGAHLAAAPQVASHDPPERPLGGEEAAEEGLAVVVVELLPPEAAHQRAPERAPHDEREWVIEPDQRRGPRPDELAHGAVVPLGDPARPRRRRRHVVAKTLSRLPRRSPM